MQRIVFFPAYLLEKAPGLVEHPAKVLAELEARLESRHVVPVVRRERHQRLHQHSNLPLSCLQQVKVGAG